MSTAPKSVSAKPAQAGTTSSALVIEPPIDLRSRVRVLGHGPVDEEAVQRAERTLKSLSNQFSSWMDDELAKLLSARDRARREGLDGPAGDDLFTAAHDIKGEAGTLGYPFAGEIAGTLCALLLSGKRAELPFRIVDLHVDAIRAIVREHARGKDHETASAMAQELHDAAVALLKKLLGPAKPAGAAKS